MKELTILMCWHHETDPEKIKAYVINKTSFTNNNPNHELISVPNRFSNKNKAWLSSDLNIFHWYVNIGFKIKSERFLLVEWDCWCNCNLKEYYYRVWDCDVVGPSVYYPERDHWNWFNSIQYLPIHAQKYATGIVPFNGILLSQKAMDEISKEILKPEYDNFNSELRLPTIAAMLRMEPVVNPVCNRSITWKENTNKDYKMNSLYHPEKVPITIMTEDPIEQNYTSHIDKNH